jgi:hypothetical protein
MTEKQSQCSKDEVITPHQTTLLKLVDSYLQSTSSLVSVHAELAPLFSSIFFKLSGYANEAIRKSLDLGSGKRGLDVPTDEVELVELDVMLPKVCGALVLVTQCIVSVTLPRQGKGETKDEAEGKDGFDGKQSKSGWVDDEVETSGWIHEEDEENWGRGDLRSAMNEARDSQGVGLVEVLIGELVY